MSRLVVAVAVLGACSIERNESRDDGVCHCTPKPSTIDVLPQLRKHVDMASRGVNGTNGRDIKLVDDEIRLQVSQSCAPCGTWVGERASVDDLFPLVHLREAARATCLGLVLRDGTTVYGDARPAACRR